MSTFRERGRVVEELFESKRYVKICGPMVRYSKLQFRTLVRDYNCDLVFTPMILGESFCRSQAARTNEFTTNSLDVPLIVQFAANTVHDFVGASHLVAPFCDGVDLNCGCPQRWARDMALGSELLQRPQVIYDLVKSCRNTIGKPFSVSVKMRLRKDAKRSVETCRQLEKCGATFLTVHARTPDQSTGEIDVETLKLVVENVGIPVVGNGGVDSLKKCEEMHENTKCKGVMVANGILTNPALFSGVEITPKECVQRWLDVCYNTTLSAEEYAVLRGSKTVRTIQERPRNLTFQCFHHHLVFMLEKILTRPQKRIFNNLKTFKDALEFVKDAFDLTPILYEPEEFFKVSLTSLDYTDRHYVYDELKPRDLSHDKNVFYDETNEGKYFKNKTEENDVCDWSDLFLESG